VAALFIGMLSGTSRDGADAVLLRFENDRPMLLASLCVSYPPPLAQDLKTMIAGRARPDEESLQRLDQELADFFALAAWGLLEKAGVKAAEVRALGSHGQTVWHHPQMPRPETIQLGDPQRIADLLGIRTIGHFRQADLAAGGQGAPLAPLLHKALMMPERGIRAVLNIGGISNISLLHANGSVTGHDTGPGNCLLDSWIQKHQGKEYDANGQWAAGGKVDRLLLDRLLDDPYFNRKAPKSTGVEYFNEFWLQGRLNSRRKEFSATHTSLRDVQATLSELTAYSIADAVRFGSADEVLVCGGGARNLDLMQRLRHLLPDKTVETTQKVGLDPDWVEGILFAWLARERLAENLQDTPPITGAGAPVLLGDVFEPTSPSSRA
jgi:anhydro-N-acetylmuramic acid kinase